MYKPVESPQATWDAEKQRRRVYARDPEWAAASIAKLVGDCHPFQQAVVEDPARLISVLVARNGGKTRGGEAKLARTMARKKKARCVFITDTKEHAANVCWEHLKDLFAAIGIEIRAREVTKTITLVKNGASLMLIGADDKREIDKLRGITWDAVVIDECASFPPQLLEMLVERVIRPRLATPDGWIMLCGTPGHDLHGLFYEATRPGGAHKPYTEQKVGEAWRGWSSHAWTLKQAGEFVESIRLKWEDNCATKIANQWSDDHPVWMREYLGLWAADDTNNIYTYRATRILDDGQEVEWNRWSPARVGPLKVAALPADRNDWLWVVSLDRGHSDDFAINGFAFSPTDPKKRIYHVLCYERKRLYARQVACLLCGARDSGGMESVLREAEVDDPEQLPVPRMPDRPDPQSPYGILGYPIGGVCDSDMTFIDELWKVYGIRCVQAKRNREEKHGAITLMNGDLVDGRMKVLAGSHLEEQMRSLQWIPDEFGRLQENKKQPCGSSDTATYGRRLIAHLFESGQVAAPEPKDAKRPTRGEPMSEPVRDDAPEWLDALSDYGDDHGDASWP